MGQKLVAGRVMKFTSAEEAIGRAGRDATRMAGVVALTIDLDTEEIVKEPKVLAWHAELPAELQSQ